MTTIPSTVGSGDPENLKASQRTCRCLDYCLIVFLVLLSMMVGSLCVFYMAWERPHQEERASASARSHTERSESIVHLRMDTIEIIDKDNIEWSTVRNAYVGRGFDVRPKEILVGKSGLYYVYSQIALECVDKSECTEEKDLSLSVLKNIEEEPILSFNVQVKNNSRVPMAFSASIRYLEATDRIRAQVNTGQKINDWHIDPKNSYLGMFWIGEDTK